MKATNPNSRAAKLAALKTRNATNPALAALRRACSKGEPITEIPAERVINRGGEDCLGNVGVIQTNRDTYVRDIYRPAHSEWYSQSRKARGRLTIAADNSVTFTLPTITGTAHFESRAAAVEYYRPYLGEPQSVIRDGNTTRYPSSAEYIRKTQKDDEAARMVDAKIAAGEIHIGPPALKPGQTLSLHREEGRYFITE
jgi:hypothetical protein